MLEMVNMLVINHCRMNTVLKCNALLKIKSKNKFHAKKIRQPNKTESHEKLKCYQRNDLFGFTSTIV
jgi:hypothetical protein